MAAITYQDFIKFHPEFAGNGAPGQTMVERAIADAETFFSEAVMGSRYVLAVRYKACALLASGRYGQVIPNNSKSAAEYEDRLKEVTRLVPRRFIVA